MRHTTFAELNALLSRDEVRVAEVGAFWGEARLRGPASPEHAVIGVPVTLHLEGKLEAVAYAELPVVMGKRRRGAAKPALFTRIRAKLRERRRAGLLRYSLPDLGLAWRGPDTDPDAVAVAAHFSHILGEEFPEPEEELARHLRCEAAALVAFLAKVQAGAAGTTQPGE